MALHPIQAKHSSAIRGSKPKSLATLDCAKCPDDRNVSYLRASMLAAGASLFRTVPARTDDALSPL
jgi:hypothetical protein